MVQYFSRFVTALVIVFYALIPTHPALASIIDVTGETGKIENEIYAGINEQNIPLSNGKDAVLTNALAGDANHPVQGKVESTQTAHGGLGGSYNFHPVAPLCGQQYLAGFCVQHGGKGGNGESSLAYTDIISNTVLATAKGYGGNGRNGMFGGNGGDGGDGTASTFITMANSGNSYANAFGGNGGNGFVAGKGGDALAQADAIATGTGSVNVNAVATAGHGGVAFTEGSEPIGSAGTARAYAHGTALNGADLNISASQNAGSGSQGIGIATDGSDTSMYNAVSGSTTGQLTLSQSANAGGGGSSVIGGNGGNAFTTLHFGDINASNVNAATNAYGGNGGSSSNDSLGTWGGDATSTINMTINNKGNGVAYAMGGTGGNNELGTGGHGGDAETLAIGRAALSQSDLGVTANSSGGTGGNGIIGGNGGTASAKATASAAEAGTLRVSAIQTGGSGGTGGRSDRNDGVSGGDGADSRIANMVSGGTTGSLYFSQTANGGNGGACFGNCSAGKAGNATSQLIVNDQVARFLSGETNATAGSGNYGGTGIAESNVTTSGSGAAIATARGGNSLSGGHDGGNAYAIGDFAAAGGGNVNVTANGGNGDRFGAGGLATATAGAITLSATEALNVSVTANGGMGGAEGGIGGGAYALANGIATNGADVSLSAYQIAGSANHASQGAIVGHGAGSFMENAVTGSTVGNLTLFQHAGGGAGGRTTDTDLYGNGGFAISRLNVTDNKAKSLAGTTVAWGGYGGHGSLGGDAEATTTLDSTVYDASVSAKASARGGNSPTSGFGGQGNATAKASGVGTKNIVTALAEVESSVPVGKAIATSAHTDGNGNTVTVQSTSPYKGGYARAYTEAGSLTGTSTKTDRTFTSGSVDRSSISNFGNYEGDFTVVGSGEMSANNKRSGQELSYISSAHYDFTLTSNNNLFFDISSIGFRYPGGFEHATLSIAVNGINYLTKEYSTVFNLLSSPRFYDLGAVDTKTSVDVMFTQILSNLSTSGISIKYELAAATMGSYHPVSAVPLPAALPLFGIGLGALGIFARRRKNDKKESSSTHV